MHLAVEQREHVLGCVSTSIPMVFHSKKARMDCDVNAAQNKLTLLSTQQSQP